MHAYVDGSWTCGFLDPSPTADRPLVHIRRQVALVPATDQFFVRDAKLSMLLEYARVLGLRHVLRKVRSRRSEAFRNDAWLSIGVGDRADATEERSVLFVISSGPRAVERATIHSDLLFELSEGEAKDVPPGHFVPAPKTDPSRALGTAAGRELFSLAGWRPEEDTAPVLSNAAWQGLLRLVLDPGTSFAQLPARPTPSQPLHRVDPSPRPDHSEPSRPTFHCFGYGQYAKTQVIPNLTTQLDLACVHEIDPMQIGPVESDATHGWDTLPHLREGDPIESAVVAGFHHTHAPTAVDLLDRGVRHVILEKPIATSEQQLKELLAALERNPSGRLHSAFQRRHSPFNARLLRDFEGPPISMAAVVYEVPLPARHWYRWPVVGNSIVSNGCHWIDHFLFLNEYAPVSRAGVERLSDQVVMTLNLENDASCVISLRHSGAPRRGVRDHCTFWKGNATAVIEDSRHYASERGYRQLSKARTHPYEAHERMYQDFAHRIANNGRGDSPQTIHVSTGTVLHLAHLLDGEVS